MMDISTRLCGVVLDNPTILASGVMGVTASSMAYAVKNGAGAVTQKSLGPVERKGHPSPIISTWESGMINAVGLSNPGIDDGINEILSYKEKCKAPFIASIFAFKKDDFGMMAKKVTGADPDLIEINISCPNVESEVGTPFALDPKSAGEVTRIVKKNTDIPVIVKLSPNTNNIKAIASEVEKAGADIINMGNTHGPGMLINVESARPILSNKNGGMSGPAVKPRVIKLVYDVYEVVKIPIIATGGIQTGRDAIEMMMAGASAVGIGSGVYYRGIDVFKKVVDEMRYLMMKNGYSCIKDMVGIAHGK